MARCPDDLHLISGQFQHIPVLHQTVGLRAVAIPSKVRGKIHLRIRQKLLFLFTGIDRRPGILPDSRQSIDVVMMAVRQKNCDHLRTHHLYRAENSRGFSAGIHDKALFCFLVLHDIAVGSDHANHKPFYLHGYLSL